MRTCSSESTFAVFQVLVLCGRLLDAADTGRAKATAQEYQAAARMAKILIENEPPGSVCFELCANSPALGQMAEQVLSEQWARCGEWEWAQSAQEVLRPFMRGAAFP